MRCMSTKTKKQASSPPLAELWRIAPAAKQCGVPGQTVDSAARTGRLPAFPLGDGGLLVRLADVERFAAETYRPKRNQSVG